jgi:2-iminobutanoate/2-iminopropanoate deaminase
MAGIEFIKVTSTQMAQPLPYSSATKANGFIFVSGQASVENGQLINDAFENQFRRTMKNLQDILAASGATLKDVCQVRSYVQQPSDVALYNQLYREYFTEPYPARTTITNCLSEALAFEMDVVAVDPSCRK